MVARALTERERAWVRLQATAPDLLATLAYAEVLALYAGGLGVRVPPPEQLVRRVVRQVLAGEPAWYPAHESFCAFLRRVVRAEIAAQLSVHARLRGGGATARDARLAPMQVGAVGSLDALMHWAGEIAGFVRQCDAAMVPVALGLVGFVRALLDEVDDGGPARAPSGGAGR